MTSNRTLTKPLLRWHLSLVVLLIASWHLVPTAAQADATREPDTTTEPAQAGPHHHGATVVAPIPGDRSGRVGTDPERCAGPHQQHLETHTATLRPYSVTTGEPTGSVRVLEFDICLVNGTELHSLALPTVKQAIDHFIGVLQTHFEVRGQSFESALTDCYVDGDPPDQAPTGTDPASPGLQWTPIIGYQLLFTKDPRIEIYLMDLDQNQQGFTVIGSFPTDTTHEPDLNYLWLSPAWLFSEKQVAGTIAHELAHRMGYTHPSNLSMIHNIGTCIEQNPFD